MAPPIDVLALAEARWAAGSRAVAMCPHYSDDRKWAAYLFEGIREDLDRAITVLADIGRAQGAFDEQ